MARPEKVAAVDEVSESLSSNAATLVTDYRGLSVTELAELRGKLRENNAHYKVVKNTLTKRAAEDAGIDGLADFLRGPTALVFCEDDPVGPMKVIRDFMKDHPELLVKAGWVEGEVLDDQATIKLADLKSRDELLAEVAGLFHGALANFARLLQAPLDHQARLFKALEDAGGVEAKGFEPEAPEGAVEETSDDEAADAPAAAAEAEPEETGEAESDEAEATGGGSATVAETEDEEPESSDDAGDAEPTDTDEEVVEDEAAQADDDTDAPADEEEGPEAAADTEDTEDADADADEEETTS